MTISSVNQFYISLINEVTYFYLNDRYNNNIVDNCFPIKDSYLFIDETKKTPIAFSFNINSKNPKNWLSYWDNFPGKFNEFTLQISKAKGIRK